MIDGGQWLHEWGVDIPSGLPIDLQKLTMRDYKTGSVDMDYDLSGYEAKWGFPYYMLSVARVWGNRMLVRLV
jgi:salicylate hydroxylase